MAVALLIIDAINPLDFVGAEPLVRSARKIVEPIKKLRGEADKAGAAVVYINDNYGAWRADRDSLITAITESDAPGSAVARQLRPRDEDYLVIKPQLSGFYATTLPALLPRLGINRLILTGVAADICVLFTAADAHMREYDLWVPEDTVAGEDGDRTRWALEIMRNSFGADTRSTACQSLVAWQGAK
jgi:nicotinamidase-related amidase